MVLSSVKAFKGSHALVMKYMGTTKYSALSPMAKLLKSNRSLCITPFSCLSLDVSPF